MEWQKYSKYDKLALKNCIIFTNTKWKLTRNNNAVYMRDEDNCTIRSNLLWAKTNPHKGLYEHMRETAIVCKVLLQESVFKNLPNELALLLELTDTEAIALCMYISGIHDIGKCHPIFQHRGTEEPIHSYIERNLDLKYNTDAKDYRHELGSQAAAKRLWKTKNRFDREILFPFAAILKLHHQGKHGKDYDMTSSSMKQWLLLQEELEVKLYDWIKPPYLSYKPEMELDAACTLMTGLVVIADWISSNAYFSSFEENADDTEIAERTQHFLKKSKLEAGNSIDIKNFCELWPAIPADHLRPLQAELQEDYGNECEMPLMLIIEAPMGEGKTEAGLFAAIRMAQYWNKSGFYVALPTSATSNQMYQRITEMLKPLTDAAAGLLHSMSWMNDSPKRMEEMEDESVEDIEQWTKPNRRALLSKYSIGTIDQVLMAALQIKYGVLRILGLSGKVLLIDEVHAYDAYMSSILKRLLEWCRVLRIPVVLLSATLPKWKKKEFIEIYGSHDPLTCEYQQYTAVYEQGRLNTKIIPECSQRKEVHLIEYCLETDHDSDFISDIVFRINNGGCFCIIVNTIEKAQKIYLRLKNDYPEIESMLFHSAFTFARRKEIEQRCLDLFGKNKSLRPSRFILVATQVVEQSLDLDFDYMISEIAPIDLLLQRTGRLHRHSNTVRPVNCSRPEFGVIIPKEYGSTELIYYPILLDRTKKIIEAVQSIHIPEDIPKMIDRVYQRDDYSEEETDDFIKQMFSEQIKESSACGIELGSPMTDDFGLGIRKQELFDDEDASWVSAKTRLGEDTVQIACLPGSIFDTIKKCLSEKITVSKELAKQITEYSISMPYKKFIKWKLESVYHLNGEGKIFGIKIYRLNCEVAATETMEIETESGKVNISKEVGLIYGRF